MKQTDTFRRFRFEEDTIIWKGSSYHIDQIKHLGYRETVTNQKMNFVTVGESRRETLVIVMDDDVNIVLDVDNAGLFIGINSCKGKDLQNLRELYDTLSKMTFKNRIKPYIDQIVRNGYIDWGDGCEFHPYDKKIIISGKEYPMSEYAFILGNGRITPKLKRKSTLKEKLGGIVAGEKCLNTSVSPDVLFALLDHYMGLRWKS